ncbi:hypothetical protein ACWGLE_09635 [Streptomyces sp. NPDC055897]
MPSYDSSRARFKFADRHIAVFAHLLDGENPPAELWASVQELQQIGLVGQEGELAPILRDLLGSLSNPLVLISVEVTGEHGPLNHGVVVGQDAVFSHDAWPGEEEEEYVSIEPSTLVWELARKVNLQQGEPVRPASATRIETTMGVLDKAFVELADAGGDEETARRLLRSKLAETAGLGEAELGQFLELVVALNATWRVTTTWDGRHEGGSASMVRALAVWDCGPFGYWIREKPEEPILPGQVGPDSPLALVRSSPGEIWDKITDLLPDKEDLVDQA